MARLIPTPERHLSEPNPDALLGAIGNPDGCCTSLGADSTALEGMTYMNPSLVRRRFTVIEDPWICLWKRACGVPLNCKGERLL